MFWVPLDIWVLKFCFKHFYIFVPSVVEIFNEFNWTHYAVSIRQSLGVRDMLEAC